MFWGETNSGYVRRGVLGIVIMTLGAQEVALDLEKLSRVWFPAIFVIITLFLALLLSVEGVPVWGAVLFLYVYTRRELS